MSYFIRVDGVYVTDAGLICEVLSASGSQIHARVVNVFFPVHFYAGRECNYQVSKQRQNYLRKCLVGKTRAFWCGGTRAGFEVGSKREWKPMRDNWSGRDPGFAEADDLGTIR